MHSVTYMHHEYRAEMDSNFNICIFSFHTYHYTDSCPCYYDTANEAVETVCSGPSTSPCICSDGSCMVSV